jgi:hypothetical protein
MQYTRRASASTFALVVATLIGGRPAIAQRINSPGESAIPVPRGVLRTTILIDLAHYNERFGTTGGVEPLGTDFSVDALGARQLPFLVPTEQNLQTITGQSDVTLSLGRLAVSEDARVTTIPIQVEFGLTRRITLGAMMPLVRTRTTVAIETDNDAAGANASANPQLDATLSASVLATNRSVQTQLAGARDALELLLERCRSDPSASPQCAVVLSDSSHAKALNDSATTIATALAETYGGGTAPPSSFVPLAESSLQAAVEARLAELSASFANFFGGGTPITARPVGALGPLTATQAQDAFGNAIFQVDPFRSVDLIGIGDIEVGVKFLVFDAVSEPTAARQRSLGMRLAVAPVVRLGTALGDVPFNWFEVPLGDGQTDIEVRGFADAVIGSHLWASFIGRYTWQLPDRVLVRIPEAPGDVFLPFFRERRVQRDLGDYFELEARPRYILNDYLSFSGVYLYRHKSQDRYIGTFVVPAEETRGLGEVTLDASTLDARTEVVEHRVGAGLTFSSLPSFQRRRSRLPLEVSFLHLQSISGSGGLTPKLQSDQVHLRFYTRLFGAPPETKGGTAR